MPALALALVGDPVAHSASPGLYRGFLAERGIDGTYEAIRVPAGEGRRALADLRARGYRGVNVTTPLKEEAYAYCDSHDEIAAASGSVNTVVFDAAGARGYNTDGAGAVGAVAAAVSGAVAGRSVLILGAGPTARAGALALREAGARVALWSRTFARARSAATAAGVDLWRPGAPCDVVLAALLPAVELPAYVRVEVLRAPAVVDANYGPRATLGALLGRPVHDGLEMLRASVRASFALFAP